MVYGVIFGVDAALLLWHFSKLIPYLLLSFLIFYWFVFFILQSPQYGKIAATTKSAVGLSEEENIIKNENIDDLIQPAIAIQSIG